MKKYVLIASGLLLGSQLALAQDTPQPATPATPAVPADPADPADRTEPATPADPSKKDTSKDKKAKAGASSKGDFASFDANGDGSLSQDEVKGNASIKFKDMDRDSDGKISRGEYESGVHASPNSSQNSDSTDKTKDKAR
jgi:hypothetical protein